MKQWEKITSIFMSHLIKHAHVIIPDYSAEREYSTEYPN